MLIRDVTLADPPYVLEAQAAGAYELLVELSALPTDGLSAPMRAALERVGDRSGEVWLHLLGLAVDTPAPRDAAALLAAVEAADPLEVRRQLLGADVPAWRRLEPGWAEAIEAAAAGDPAAQARLLTHPRYYGGAARQALEVLLPLGPEETRRRLLAVLGRWHAESFAAREAGLVELLEADARETRELAATMAPARLIELVCGGFAYEPEPECPRVLLIPQVAARPWLLLCQHRDLRIICHPARPRDGDRRAATAEGLLRLGRALGDSQRQRILTALAGGPLDLDELAGAVGLSRSTVHHHMGLLRAAGLVRVAGNARRYRYGLRPEAVAEATALLASVLTAPGEERP
ncbi:MAG TPA: winged helix-turn-helix domain-containing protein [Actinomycetota bacterium]|jgi:DNA-binding transcriptional ArsR family regulator|nr:winged helix-turn-helix domain-containing protein [Actinomycetota bacterium]